MQCYTVASSKQIPVDDYGLCGRAVWSFEQALAWYVIVTVMRIIEKVTLREMCALSAGTPITLKQSVVLPLARMTLPPVSMDVVEPVRGRPGSRRDNANGRTHGTSDKAAQ